MQKYIIGFLTALLAVGAFTTLRSDEPEQVLVSGASTETTVITPKIPVETTTTVAPVTETVPVTVPEITTTVKPKPVPAPKPVPTTVAPTPTPTTQVEEATTTTTAQPNTPGYCQVSTAQGSEGQCRTSNREYHMQQGDCVAGTPNCVKITNPYFGWLYKACAWNGADGPPAKYGWDLGGGCPSGQSGGSCCSPDAHATLDTPRNVTRCGKYTPPCN